jgi:hypothetical protein
VAAAVAAAAGVRPRDVDVAEVQRQLAKQGVFLPEPPGAGATRPA